MPQVHRMAFYHTGWKDTGDIWCSFSVVTVWLFSRSVGVDRCFREKSAIGFGVYARASHIVSLA